MKRLSIYAIIIAVLCILSACSPNCKAEGCEDEIYQDDYCQYHYVVNTAKNEIDKLGKDIFNGINNILEE